MVNDYNTQREPILHKEYGRNIKKLTSFIKTIEDKEKRTKYAHTLVKLMRQIIPGSIIDEDSVQKYWDDLQIVSGFDLDIDAPYPIPDEKILLKKPKKINYHDYEVAFKHYGRNIELLINQTIEIEDPEKRETAIIYIGKLMKTFHASWSKENVDDPVILKNIEKISKGKLTIDLKKYDSSNLFEVLYKDRDRDRDRDRDKGKSRSSGGRRSGRGQGKNNGRQNRRRRS
jgi:hypothetical protein